MNTISFYRWGGPPCPLLVGNIGAAGFQPVRPHRQDAGATKNFSELRPQASRNGLNLDSILAALARLILLP